MSPVYEYGGTRLALHIPSSARKHQHCNIHDCYHFYSCCWYCCCCHQCYINAIQWECITSIIRVVFYCYRCHCHYHYHCCCYWSFLLLLLLLSQRHSLKPSRACSAGTFSAGVTQHQLGPVHAVLSCWSHHASPGRAHCHTPLLLQASIMCHRQVWCMTGKPDALQASVMYHRQAWCITGKFDELMHPWMS